MAASSGLVLKAYLLIGKNKKSEKRYVTLTSGTENSYVYLRAKLTQSFPSLTHGSFRVFWLDHDKERIIISSDEEFTFALRNMGDVKKLYIKSNEQSDSVNLRRMIGSSAANDQGSIFHSNVTCDTCQSRIRGFRYKCLVCDDYDLCENCECARSHADHVMLRLPKNVNNLTSIPGYDDVKTWVTVNLNRRI